MESNTPTAKFEKAKARLSSEALEGERHGGEESESESQIHKGIEVLEEHEANPLTAPMHVNPALEVKKYEINPEELDSSDSKEMRMVCRLSLNGRIVCRMSASFTDNPFDASEWRRPILDHVLEALGDSNTSIIGVYGSSDANKATLVERVLRRVRRDNMFNVVLMASVTKKPNIRKIQGQLAHVLELNFPNRSDSATIAGLLHVFGLNFPNRSDSATRARLLHDRIKQEQKIIVILRDLFKGLDLAKVGIPFGADHTGCKILLTSHSEEVLSNHMRTERNFMV